MNLHPGLPFTEMGGMIDGVAVTACIASGMIVIVETNLEGSIEGILGAYMLRSEAWNNYTPLALDDRYAIIIPTENGPLMYYGDITAPEFDNACRS